mgnify:CR=1 FL=1
MPVPRVDCFPHSLLRRWSLIADRSAWQGYAFAIEYVSFNTTHGAHPLAMETAGAEAKIKELLKQLEAGAQWGNSGTSTNSDTPGPDAQSQSGLGLLPAAREGKDKDGKESKESKGLAVPTRWSLAMDEALCVPFA